MSSPISENILQAGLETLLSQMEKLAAEAQAGRLVNPAELERIAKAISSHLKAVDDLSAHHAKKAQVMASHRHTAYEDFPPPTSAERARFIKKLEKLYAAIDIDGALARAALRHERKRLDRDEP